ncbi:MAG: single-stranded DNA-binding protein [bacterium]
MNKRKFKTDWTSAFKKMKEQNSGKKAVDERIYRPEFDDNGTARSIIRFLPSPDTDIPYVDVYSHYFSDVGGWFIENCPTTKGLECPVCKENTRIWDSDEDTARKRKRKRNFYANILIVDDKKNPSNNGKVMLFKYGIKIHEKIMELIEDDGIMPFDYYEGANFDLKIKMIKVGNTNMPNYDSATFKDTSSIGTDEEIEKINSSLYPIASFVSNDKFKSYDDLEEKLLKVIGEKTTRTKKSNNDSDVESENVFDDVNDDSSDNLIEDVENTTNDLEEDDVVFDDDDDSFFAEIEDED